MKQVEVRLALVLYGGVSLAVYMHGVSREFLNLLRASKAFRLRVRPNTEPAQQTVEASGPTSADAYLALFEELGKTVELRVIVDAIAGASAGGINGIMLSRAIAHDLTLDDHRDLWLRNADITRLSEVQGGLKGFFKRLMTPLVDRIVAAGMKTQFSDPETRQKLCSLMRARWFKPPFSGERFVGWMLDAYDAMDRPEKAGETLLPPGHRLDLFVTLTDYHGRVRRIALDDPAFIEETEHRKILRFGCTHTLGGELISDFEPDGAPDLAFAARATSSFPGAFPPAGIEELDRVLAARRRAWPGRQAFVSDRLGIALEDVGARVFIDGSVIMNKPFAPVIEALGGRPASREVVRRVVYVDPQPIDQTPTTATAGPPGFFRTILASLAHIPRNEPVADDLQAIEERNARARRILGVITAAEPEVERQVARIIKWDPDQPPTVTEVTRCRAEANEAAHAAAGHAYLGYERLKVQALIEKLSLLVCALADRGGVSIEEETVEAAIDRWLAPPESAPRENKEAAHARTVEFLRGLDVDFRVRRQRFVIRALNELYRTATGEASDRPSDLVDELKATLYQLTDELENRWSVDHYGAETVAAAVALAGAADEADAPVEGLFARLEAEMALADVDRLHDDVFAVMGLNYLEPEHRDALTRAYVGFAFYDVITFPILQWNDLSEINEILIDRISPNDARDLADSGVVLKGAALQSFGAFFNQGWREHDYLWGRLNAAERLVGVLLSAVGPARAARVDREKICAALYRAILEEESSKLTADPRLIADIAQALESRMPG